MALHKGLLNSGFHLAECEKHFHDHDETWIILKGKGIGFWINHTGNREEFELEAGDVWMIPAGYEHGSVDCNSDDFNIAAFNGTYAPGAHKPKHYYIEEEGYISTLQLAKIPTSRYSKNSKLPEFMRVVVFVEEGKMKLQTKPLPELTTGHILCKTLFSGLTNGTERNSLMGGNYGGKYPTQPGYQNVARVIALGENVTDYKVGEVIFSGGHHKHAGYFTPDVSCPNDPNNLILKLPEGLNLKWSCMFGMASVAMHDVKRSEIGLGDRALVVGAGSVGLFTAQIAHAAGARVTKGYYNPPRLEIAKSTGVQSTVTIKDDSDRDRIRSTGPYDVVFEDSGAPVLDRIIGDDWGKGLITHRGKIIIIAGRFDVTYHFNAGQSHEATLLHASHFNQSDLRELCRLVMEGIIQVEPIIRDVVPIEQAHAIYDRLRDDPSSLLGTVFDWSD